MLSDSLAPLGRTLFQGVLAYVALIVLLRISGKRTLSKWNAFDFVVTVAFGSTLASTLLSRQTSLAQGVMAFAVLVTLQAVITWLSVRSRQVEDWVKAQPVLLVHRGSFCEDAMRRERVTESEVRAAVRSHGIADLSQVEAVVLETDGSISVIEEAGQPGHSTLTDVQGYPTIRPGDGRG